MKTNYAISFLLFWSVSIPSALAATLNVPAQYPTIQSGIVAASLNDTVLVEPNNTYFENIDFLGKDIVVMTPDPAADRHTTIIDGGGNGTVATFANHETVKAVLQGFTLQNGTGTLHSWWYYSSGSPTVGGGGILCDSPYDQNPAASNAGSSPTLRYLIVQDNQAMSGGGLCIWLRSRPVVENCIFRNNFASHNGGGIMAIEVFNKTAGPVVTLTNVEVTHNTCGLQGGAGVSANYSSMLALINCTVADNIGNNTNGEALWRANGAWFDVTNSIFWGTNGDLLFDLGGQSWTSVIDFSDAPNVNGPLNVGGNMLSTAPLFINGPMNDYRLSAGSPCIDAGTPANAPSIDLDGNPRTGNPDLGAYEVSTVGIPEINAAAVSVWPNPADGMVTIRHGASGRTAILFAPDGRRVRQFSLHPSGFSRFDVSGLANGYYLLEIDGFAAGKVLKR